MRRIRSKAAFALLASILLLTSPTFLAFAPWVLVSNGSFESGTVGLIPDNWVMHTYDGTDPFDAPKTATFIHEMQQTDQKYFEGTKSLWLHSKIIDEGLAIGRGSETIAETEDWINDPYASYVRLYVRDIKSTHSLFWGWDNSITVTINNVSVVETYAVGQYWPYIFTHGQTLNWNLYNDTVTGADGQAWYVYECSIPASVDKTHMKIEIIDWAWDWTFYDTSYYSDLEFVVDKVELLTTPPVDWWPMFHHDLSHSGYSTSTGPTTNQTLWTHGTGSWGLVSSPAIVNGIVYIGSTDHNVYALNATTGTQIWNCTTGAYLLSSPAVADGIVYVGSWDNKLYALNATTGTQIWNYTAMGAVESSPAIANGIVYIGSNYGEVCALNATTGALVWTYLTSGFAAASPAVANGLVYVGSIGGQFYALNATTGALVWTYQTFGFVGSSPAVADGVVFVCSYDFRVYALNATTGAQIWNYTTGNALDSSPAVAYGVVYVGSQDCNIYALEAATGALVWNFTTGDTVDSSPAVANGVVYVGSDDNKVYALDAATGASIWTYTTSSSVVSSPAVVNGILYVGSFDGNVYAFGPVHDVVVTDVTSSKDGCLPMPTVGQGYSLNITLTAANFGSYSETFNVTLYAGANAVNQTEVTLTNGNSTTVTLAWDTTGFAFGNYTVSAYAWPVPNETITANNNFTGDMVYVGIPGDINGDGVVNILDAIMLSNAFLSTPTSSNWNPNADINGDGIVNILDAIILSNNFLRHFP